MDQCKECGMSLNEGTKCKNEDGICCKCCNCEPACQCGPECKDDESEKCCE